MKNKNHIKFGFSIVFSLSIFLLGAAFALSPQKVSASSKVSCNLNVSVDNTTGNVTIYGNVRETHPEQDNSFTTVSIGDSAGLGTADNTCPPGSGCSASGDYANASYTRHFPDGAYTADIEGTGRTNPGNQTSSCQDTKTFTVLVGPFGGSCAINSFTADNTNLAYNTGTTLHLSLDKIGSFTWAITLLSGTKLPSPSSGTGSSGASGTGKLTGTHVYRLTCGTDTKNLTVNVAAPAPTPTPVNGSCAATHYNCSAGSSVNHRSNSNTWTWDCAGSDGGSNTFCSENKKAPSGNISATSCQISAGASTCDSFVDWNTKDLTSGTTEVTKNNPSNTHISFNTSGTNVRNTIRYGVDGQTTFFLYHNIGGTPTILDQASVTASCGAGSIWDGSICKAIPDGMSGTLTPAASSCDIAVNKSNCSINFSWNTINPVSVSKVTKNPANTVVGAGNSGTSIPFVVKHDMETFFLYNNAIELATSTVTANCAAGTTWAGVKCVTVNNGECLNGGVNPPTCTVGSGGECINGAINPPICTTDPVGECVNGAINPPICNVGADGNCLNGMSNPPACSQSKIPTFKEN